MHFYGFTISLTKYEKFHINIFGFLHQKNKNSTLVFLDIFVTKIISTTRVVYQPVGIYFSSFQCILEYAKIRNTFLSRYKYKMDFDILRMALMWLPIKIPCVSSCAYPINL